MGSDYLITTQKEQERVIILAVHHKKQDDFTFKESLDETVSLCQTAGLIVENVFTQNRDKADSKSYLGSGRIEEIAELTEREDIEYDVVIVNDELTTSQSKHLNERLGVKIIDRTQLILDIFASRAKSKEGQLQVELAQNEYLLPRLSGHGVSLSRLGGGIGTRGPGETKLETNRRHIRARIHDIKVQLQDIKSHRQRYREQRKRNQLFQIALVGYTNAGKSSWYNQLTDSETYEENLLFATLDPKSKLMTINQGFSALLSDTVGFIQQLPTHLIDAFSSTLEEAKYADLLIHVVDRSHPNYKGHIETVNELLTSLEMNDIPTLILLNKKDLVDEPLDESSHDTLFVSAKDQEDISKVKAFISEFLKREMSPYQVMVDAADGQSISRIKHDTIVDDIDFIEEQNGYLMSGYEVKDSGTIKRILKLEKRNEDE